MIIFIIILIVINRSFGELMTTVFKKSIIRLIDAFNRF